MSTTKTYKMRGVVLRKTKLGEKDLIVSLLAEDGSLVRAVAKGARKPGGSLAARAEIFSVVDVMLAQGRSLDVITDARIAPGGNHAFGLEQSACATALAELVDDIAQEGLAHRRLFDMTCAAFASISEAEPLVALSMLAAGVLKVLASEGIRPSFDACVACGTSISTDNADARIAISFEDGGAICENCQRPPDAVLVGSTTVAWARALLYARFEEIAAMGADASVSFDVLQFARQWARVYIGKDIKSVNFILTSGLF